MIIGQIAFDRNNTIPTAKVSTPEEVAEAFNALKIFHPAPVIVLVGGATRMKWLEGLFMRKAVGIIAKVAEETGCVLIDGGTQAGVMQEIGRQRKGKKYAFPLVGVVHGDLLLKRKPQAIFDPNHTHFFLIPGDRWGDESPWIAKIATLLAGRQKSITVLVNGGKISRSDVENSLKEGRTTIVFRRTGRLADELQATGQILEVSALQGTSSLLSFFRSKLS
ncbi:MAG: hypothetical protein K8S20_17065 [Chloroflexi bacterium]|nr:hypothetical protein [Chloroflexota bacterium]